MSFGLALAAIVLVIFEIALPTLVHLFSRDEKQRARARQVLRGRGRRHRS